MPELVQLLGTVLELWSGESWWQDLKSLLEREGLQYRVGVEDLASIASLYSVKSDGNQSVLRQLELLEQLTDDKK